ncbi:HD domain-containing protein [Salinibius halmophilus]|uniref:HD domain-containing protein n=1 Tax=Salinibius halmophilus TaxID=1853216 RepID=UPI000E65FB38|nr:HD domain-containing protein [Salinibius halmophilus]
MSQQSIIELALELDKLKSVYRKSIITSGERYENSAEHSWHLAMTIMGFANYLPPEVNINRCVQIALCHDLCEVGAGDVCLYHDQTGKHERELDYMNAFMARFPSFGSQAKDCWQEYEDQQTLESQWVSVFDRLLPFTLNIATEGRTWREQKITPDMVRNKHAFIADIAPELHQWMLGELETAVANGWFEQ